MYVQVGILALVGDHSTVPLTRISCNTFFSKSQNVRKAENLCIDSIVNMYYIGYLALVCLGLNISIESRTQKNGLRRLNFAKFDKVVKLCYLWSG